MRLPSRYFFSVVKTRLVLFLGCGIVFLLLASMAPSAGFADDTGGEQDSAVAKFKSWLEERDQTNTQQLEADTANSPQSSTKAQQSTVATSSQTSDNTSDEAFQQMVKQTMPMSPEQIKAYRNLVQKTQQAAATFPEEAPPKPISSTMVVNMAPGSSPPAIRMYQGFITSLVFVDSTGAVWPVVSYDLGNTKAFNIQWDRKSNVLMVQPQQAYTLANLAVKLEGLPTPVMLTLVPGQSVVDYRVDLRVNGLGPNAKQTVDSGLPPQTDGELLSVLDGIPPSGSQLLKVEGHVATAWRNGDLLYIRTRFTLLSPAWMNVMQSPDGMYAYKLQMTPSIMISHYGKPMTIKLEDGQA